MSEPPGHAADATLVLRPKAPDLLADRARKRALLGEQRRDSAEGRPADPTADPAAEFAGRAAPGEPPAVSDDAARFPEHDRTVANLVRHREAVRSLGGSPPAAERGLRLPESGDELFGFRLRQPLGAGAFARVFIAEQPDLASRPVVLKISAIEGTEPQTLARLQHTNIVPIYSVHEDPRAGLRAVCMPYFGGASLSSVLERLWAETKRPTLGRQLADAARAVAFPTPEVLAKAPGGNAPGPGADARTPLAIVGGLSYFRAVAWVVARLAEGLEHAHQRGILHRDIKPSNVLIDADGQPLLLDFNVAQETACDPADALLGGTVAYAAPEHLVALIERTPELIARVDRRSDVYSLGLVLAEMLTGTRLFGQGGSYSAAVSQLAAMAFDRSKGVPNLRALRPDLPWGLESIARKCLDPDPGRRYRQAEELAEDLRRFLDDRPLRFAPELSRSEQVRKFLRRHPRLTTSGTVSIAAAVFLLAVGSALIGARGHLAEARGRERKRDHDAGMARALCLVNTAFAGRDQLRDGAATCASTLALYDARPDWSGLSRAERRQVAEDRRELLLMLAGARVKLADGARGAVERALALLDRAEALPGLAPSKALWLDRATYHEQLGATATAAGARARADAIEAVGARDYYLIALAHTRRGGTVGYRRAIAALDRALTLNPRHYWSALQRGICRMELGESAQAIGDFGACVGLWPEHAWAYYNRGYVFDRGGMKAEAIADYTAALDRDPAFAAARVNRGVARLELEQYAEALLDFDEARRLGKDDATLLVGRGVALEALGRHAEADADFRAAFARVSADTDPTTARLRWAYGFAVARRLPDAARAAFDEALRLDPRAPQALYGRAMLAMEDHEDESALAFFDRALAADPTFVAARRYRAVLRARRGDWERAVGDINGCLEREPNSGATLYAAACVAARASAGARDPRAFDQAFDLLKRALDAGAGAKARDDADLAPLRSDPRFPRLVAGSTSPEAGAPAPRPVRL